MGFIYRHSKPFYLVEFKNNLTIKFYQLFENEKSKCPQLIPSLPKNSILVIGHAFGSHVNLTKRGIDKIAPKVKDFYLNNKNNIDSIIFNGDVLYQPSLKKWETFYATFDKNLKIYIAPGNHDVGGKVFFDNAARDVFNQTFHRNQKGKKYPFKVIINDTLFIITDSNARKNIFAELFPLLETEKRFQKIYVISHHVIPEGLQSAANAPRKHGFVKNSILKKN